MLLNTIHNLRRDGNDAVYDIILMWCLCVYALLDTVSKKN